MLLIKDRFGPGYFTLRFRGNTWNIPARTVQSAMSYIGTHLEKFLAEPQRV